MSRAPLSALLVALLFSASIAHASGVERGSVPAEVGANMGVPSSVQAVAKETIRARCDLAGVDRVYAQDFTTDVVADKSGAYKTRFSIEYTVYYLNASYVKSIVVTASAPGNNGAVKVETLSSDLCK